jgi:hypothetical protein
VVPLLHQKLTRVSTAQRAIAAQNTRTIFYGTGSGIATGLAISAGQSLQSKLEKMEAQ